MALIFPEKFLGPNYSRDMFCWPFYTRGNFCNSFNPWIFPKGCFIPAMGSAYSFTPTTILKPWSIQICDVFEGLLKLQCFLRDIFFFDKFRGFSLASITGSQQVLFFLLTHKMYVVFLIFPVFQMGGHPVHLAFNKMCRL